MICSPRSRRPPHCGGRKAEQGRHGSVKNSFAQAAPWRARDGWSRVCPPVAFPHRSANHPAAQKADHSRSRVCRAAATPSCLPRGRKNWLSRHRARPATARKRTRRGFRLARWGPPGARAPAAPRAMAAPKSLSGPAQRAETTPGAPPRAATQNPESSARLGRPLALVAASAFSRALPKKSGAVSSGSANPIAAADTSSTPSGSTRAAISASLPRLWLARTSLLPRASRRAISPAPRVAPRTGVACRPWRGPAIRRIAPR